MKRLVVAVLMILAMPAAFAFDTTRRPVRIGVLHASDAYDARVSALVNRMLREELRKRGFDAFDTNMTFDEAARSDENVPDFYVEIEGGAVDSDNAGGVAIGGRTVDVSMDLVVARVAADLRVYDAGTMELITTESLKKKSAALLPTSIGVGGYDAFAVLAMPFVERAHARSVARDAARDAASRVADAIRQ